MEWCFECPDGAVTVRQEGDRAICQAIRSARGDGLYKAWLKGGKSRFLLGTLIPDGGALRLRRIVPVIQLKNLELWPPAGAEITMAFPFGEPSPPPGFQWEDHPERRMGDPLLAQSAKELGRVLIRKEENGFSLAVRFQPGTPFPLTPLFCLSCLEQISGTWYLRFDFSRRGYPERPHSSWPAGETMGEIHEKEENPWPT